MLNTTTFWLHIFFFISFISHFIIFCCAFTCIHNKLTTLKTSAVFIRSLKYHEIQEKREKDPSLFEPLEVSFYLDNIDPSISQNVIYNIQSSLNKVKDYISQTFQVRKRKRPFLLKRFGCTKRWQTGVNKGQCSTFKSGPELCESENINFQIADKFLDKVEVYDHLNKTAKLMAPLGSGLMDSNFIQFITSESSTFCEGTDIFAYGTYCRLDDVTNEPLAGILNLCPSYFRRKVYTTQHYYNIILHEMFHILGFSNKMFEKYLPCQKGIYCNIPKRVIQEDSFGTPRMMYPFVIQNMQEHFSCNNSDFGAPMDIETTNNETTAESSSHWHPILMFSSIMTPKFEEFDHIFVDNMTLAAFASTGWYRVNFTNAQDFKFGKDQGCNFGMNDTCEGPYLCDPKSQSAGCDLLHKTIGTCQRLTPNHPCGIYQAYSQENCESTDERKFGLDFYALGYKQKCLIIQENNESSAFCLPIKCKSGDSYDIIVNGTWYPCKSHEKITLENNISALCPDVLLFCAPQTNVTETIFLSAKGISCSDDAPFFIYLRISFKLPTVNNLMEYNSFKNFKVTVVRKVAEKINIPVNYIVNASLNVFKKVYMDFTICPPSSSSMQELVKIVNQSQIFLDNGDFHEILKGSKDLIISSTDIRIDPDYNIAFSDYEGFTTLLAFPTLCAIFLVVTFIASLIRMFHIQKRKPKRTAETTNEYSLSDVASS